MTPIQRYDVDRHIETIEEYRMDSHPKRRAYACRMSCEQTVPPKYLQEHQRDLARWKAKVE